MSDSDSENNFDLREFLIDLAEKGEIEKSPVFVKKANIKNLEKIYEKYLQKQAKDTNEMICDMIISKTGDLLETIGWVKSGSQTSKKLQQKKLFMRDFTNFMSHITPYVPFLGFVEGGISLAEDVGTHTVNKVFFEEKEEKKEEEE